MRDVHYYDAQWKHNINTRFNIANKFKLFKWLYNNCIKLNKTENGIKGLELVINDTQKYPNLDNANKIYADDILAEICIHLMKTKNKIIIDLLLEQMNDMYNTGQCPQGRTTRLFQIYNTFN